MPRNKSFCERAHTDRTLLHEVARDPCAFWSKGQAIGFAGHDAISDEAHQLFQGNFFGMFREPVSRVASAFAWFGKERANAQLNASEYARRARGTAVKMLSGQASGEECNSGYALCDLTEVPNVSAALKRLESFAYVGLTSEWRLSITSAAYASVVQGGVERDL